MGAQEEIKIFVPCVQGTFLTVQYKISIRQHLILQIGSYYFPHFTNEKTKPREVEWIAQVHIAVSGRPYISARAHSALGELQKRFNFFFKSEEKKNF